MLKKVIYGKYQIHEDGSIININSKISLKFNLNKNLNLYKVNLSIPKKTTFLIHKLVAQSFITEYDEKTDTISFLDGNTQNYQLSNLSIYRKIKIYPK